LAATADGFAPLHARILRDEVSLLGLGLAVADLRQRCGMTPEPRRQCCQPEPAVRADGSWLRTLVVASCRRSGRVVVRRRGEGATA
jgi:hypothetical protein